MILTAVLDSAGVTTSTSRLTHGDRPRLTVLAPASLPSPVATGRYHFDMAFVVKLSREDTEALRAQAAREHRSMHEVAVLAIQARIAADRRAAVLDDLYDAAAVEDAELLDRLAK
jgi:hypothetical protein